MSHLDLAQTKPAEEPVTSVAFVPPPAWPVDRKSVELPALPLLDALLREMGEALLHLARRARRLGPVEEGAVVLVTGCGRGVGCSTLALALAAAAAGERPVLLIDADLDRPRLSGLLGGPLPFGWEQTVRGQYPGDEALRHPDRHRILSFLPLRGPVLDPAGLLASPELPAWLARLRGLYEIIFLDGGPASSSAARWAARTDVAILVADSRPLSADDRARAAEQLEAEGGHLLGVVETFLEAPPLSRPRFR